MPRSRERCSDRVTTTLSPGRPMRQGRAPGCSAWSLPASSGTSRRRTTWPSALCGRRQQPAGRLDRVDAAVEGDVAGDDRAEVRVEHAGAALVARGREGVGFDSR